MQAIQALDYHCEGDYGRVILDAAPILTPAGTGSVPTFGHPTYEHPKT